MKKTLLDNNKITARAEQAMLDRIPVDQRTLRIIGKTLEPKNLNASVSPLSADLY